MKNSSIYVFLYSLFFTSCNSKEETRSAAELYSANNTTVFTQMQSKEPFIIKTNHIVTQLYDSVTYKDNPSSTTGPYAVNISYILPESKDGLIGDIDKLEFFKDHLYILDSKDNSITIFNTNGQRLNKIQNIGRGPREYLKILDFSIDRKNELIVVGAMEKIQYYDLNGNFVEEHKQDNYFVAMACDNSGTLHCFSTKNQNEGYQMENWSIFSQKKDSVLAVGFPFYPIYYNDILPPLDQIMFKNYNNDILSVKLWTDSIYHIKSDSTYKLHAFLEIEHGQSRSERIKNFTGTNDEAIKISETSFRINSFLENSNCIFGSYSVPNKGGCNFLFDKSSGIQYHINNLPFACGYKVGDENFMVSSLLHFPKYVSNDDRFVGYYWPMELEKMLFDYKKGFLNFEDKTLIKYFEEYSINGNPLIVIFSINFRNSQAIKQQ